MEKVKIQRRYSDGIGREYGNDNPLIKAMMARSFEVARKHRQRYLVSRFMGSTIVVVTRNFANCVKQSVFLAEEVPQQHREAIAKGPLIESGIGFMVQSTTP